jgi:hypothetical protein
MGDRTSVTLAVLHEHAEEVEEIADTYQPVSAYSEGSRVCFDFDEVNYGELPFLRTLEERGIAYDSDWSPGDDYVSGTRYCRYSEDGLLQTKEVQSTERNPDLQKLLDRIDDWPALRKFILEHKEQVSEPGWDNQLEYGKRYKARMLLQPKS